METGSGSLCAYDRRGADAELDAIEAEELLRTRNGKRESGNRDAAEGVRKEQKLQQLRDEGNSVRVYEIPAEGNKDQVNVARNILEQLDTDAQEIQGPSWNNRKF